MLTVEIAVIWFFFWYLTTLLKSCECVTIHIWWNISFCFTTFSKIVLHFCLLCATHFRDPCTKFYNMWNDRFVECMYKHSLYCRQWDFSYANTQKCSFWVLTIHASDKKMISPSHKCLMMLINYYDVNVFSSMNLHNITNKLKGMLL